MTVGTASGSIEILLALCRVPGQKIFGRIVPGQPVRRNDTSGNNEFLKKGSKIRYIARSQRWKCRHALFRTPVPDQRTDLISSLIVAHQGRLDQIRTDASGCRGAMAHRAGALKPIVSALDAFVFGSFVASPSNRKQRRQTSQQQQNAASPDQTNQSPQALEMKSVQQGLIPPQTNPETGEVVKDQNGKGVLDYNLVIPNMLLHYFPNGMLGLGLTALLASFMSGMAGNVTAFNTVWTYDIFKAYIRRDATDENLLVVGQLATFFGVAISVGVAYFVAAFNNIMDVLQLVFAFVNAPLFATFLLGMFWKRATGHGAFFGLLSGTVGAAVHQGLTISAGSTPGVKGAWIALVHTYPSQMAQNFWTAIYAWTVCFLVTIVISLFTEPRREEDLKGLVYALTEKAHETGGRWYLRPVPVGIAVLTLTLILNLIFR